MSTLPEHPDIDKNGNRRKLNLIVNAEVPRVLDHMETLKSIIQQELAAYEAQERARKKKIDKAKAQAHETQARILREREAINRNIGSSTNNSKRLGDSSGSGVNSSSREDDSYMETLSALHRLKAQQNETLNESHANRRLQGGSQPIVSYPDIPQRRIPLDYYDQGNRNIPGAFPGTDTFPPRVPPKIDDFYNNSPLSSVVVSTPPPEVPAVVPSSIEHKNKYSTEGGLPLRTTFLPVGIREKFLQIAKDNTRRNLETCGILCGKLNRNAFFINYLVIPPQESTSDTCSTTNEEVLFEFIDKNELFILGWIHTHPTQSCFLSSIDLHTQNSYQIMLPEAVAIVCAPQHDPSYGIFRLTDPPGVDIIKKCLKASTFHPHSEADLYKTAFDPGHIIIRENIPFQTKDLR